MVFLEFIVLLLTLFCLFQTYQKLNIVYVAVAMLLSHVLGVLLLSAGPLFTSLSSLPTEDSLYFGFLLVSLLTVIVPLLFNSM